ncbi:phosphatase PAP2 family protein [Persephonella sp.]|uniref:phosphatase PAP2 family protein n=1 Tax=Persephonella sp. TaxID=2060922 RepID=UPI00260EFE87|nr:phosphatase PAP2 family protein [Persephonella sp.]
MAKERVIPPDWELRIRWNVKLFRAINNKRSKFLDKFYKYYFRLGKSYTLPLFLPFFYIYGRWEALIHLTISLIITGILMPALKYTFRHQRPSKLLEDVYLLEPVGFKSFPSADAAYAFTLLGVILFYGSWWIILLFIIYALLIAFGRIYMGAHFPIDVLVGALTGIISGIAGYYLKIYLKVFINGYFQLPF